MTGPHVFRKGDPVPDDSVRAVLDKAGNIWPRIDGTDDWYCTSCDPWPWTHVLAFGPLVECHPLPDYEAAVKADHAARGLMGHVMYGRPL